MKVIKRDGQKVDFDASKIENAVAELLIPNVLMILLLKLKNGMSLMEIIFQFIVLKDKFLKS